MDSVDTAVVLGGGTPQGCPASPTIWVIVVDFALACARLQKGGEIKVQGEPLRVIAFADDLAATGKTAAALAETVQGLVTALGAIGVRFNARKSYYLWSAAAARAANRAPTEKPAQPLRVHVLDAEGRWRTAELTSVPPVGNADGDTLEKRGAARYLGVYFSFEGCDGEPWAEQDAYAKRIVNGFFARCTLLDPDVAQYCMLVQSLLASKLLYGGRIR